MILAVGLLGVAYQVAVLVIDQSVGGSAGTVRGGPCLDMHLDIAAVFIGAPYLDRDGIAVQVGICLYFDGIVAIVLKLEVWARPAYGGVQPGWQIADAKVVTGPFGYLEIGIQRAVVKR